MKLEIPFFFMFSKRNAKRIPWMTNNSAILVLRSWCGEYFPLRCHFSHIGMEQMFLFILHIFILRLSKDLPLLTYEVMSYDNFLKLVIQTIRSEENWGEETVDRKFAEKKRWHFEIESQTRIILWYAIAGNKNPRIWMIFSISFWNHSERRMSRFLFSLFFVTT